MDIHPTFENRHCYVSGPISGLPMEDVMFRFDRVENELLGRGWEVVNPLKVHNICDSFKPGPGLVTPLGYKFNCHAWGEPVGPDLHTYDCYMRSDIVAMMTYCDTICMLDGWPESKGSCMEYQLAEKLDFRFLFADSDGKITSGP